MNPKSILAALSIALFSLCAHAAYTGIHAAAADDDVVRLKEYLNKDAASLSARNGANRTPLCVAAMLGNTNAIEFLLSQGADVNDQGFQGLTPLADLAKYGSRNDQKCAAIAAILIAHGADVNSLDVMKETPLLMAVEMKKSKLARVLLEHGATQTPTYPGANSKMTALHMAITDKDIDIVKLLLEFKAPLNMTNRDGATPLIYAEQRDLTEIATLLRQAAPASEQGAWAEPPPTREAMRALAHRIATGDDKAFAELAVVAEKLYQGMNRGTDYLQQHARVMSNLGRMMAAFDVLGEEAGKGNEKAMAAIKKAQAVRRLSSFTFHAFGLAAAGGNKEALDFLLNYKDGVSTFTANTALCLPVAANVTPAVDNFIAWLQTDSPYKTGQDEVMEVTNALADAAAKGNLKAKEALAKFCAAHPDKN